MNYQIGIKFLFTGISLIILSFCANTAAFASDYQYKILDPKYNPDAERVVDGELPPVQEVEPYESSSFDLKTFMAIFALIVFPMFFMSLAVKTFKNINNSVPGTDSSDADTQQRIGNIRIEPKSKKQEKKEQTIQQKTTQTQSVGPKAVKNTATVPVQKASVPVQKMQSSPVAARKNNAEAATSVMTPKKKLPRSANSSINKFFSSPVQKAQNPMLLNTSSLSSNKGLCLVQYNSKFSLIGYINDNIFMLNQFDNVNSSEIRSRLSDSTASRDRYIVRLGDYKALVEVTDTNMNLLLEL